LGHSELTELASQASLRPLHLKADVVSRPPG
jgi:hypothetical protein